MPKNLVAIGYNCHHPGMRKAIGWAASITIVLAVLVGAWRYQTTLIRADLQKRSDDLAMRQCKERGMELFVIACNFQPDKIPYGYVIEEPSIAVKRAIPITQSDK